MDNDKQLDAAAYERALSARAVAEDAARREGERELQRKTYQRAYQQANRLRLREQRRKKLLADPRGPYSRQRLGVDSVAFQQMLSGQQWRCAVCRQESKHWHLDHEHATGKVRAVLCASCNKGLGHFKDDPERLRAAAAYLELHGLL